MYKRRYKQSIHAANMIIITFVLALIGRLRVIDQDLMRVRINKEADLGCLRNQINEC